MTTPRTVLVAIDERESSRRVVTFVNHFFADLDVHVIGINVGQAPAVWIAPGVGAGAYFAWPLADEAIVPTARDHERARRSAASTVEASGLADDEVVAELGDPVAAICRAAIDHCADMVVVGDSHKSAWRRLVEGSVKAEVEREVPCPVLVVP